VLPREPRLLLDVPLLLERVLLDAPLRLRVPPLRERDPPDRLLDRDEPLREPPRELLRLPLDRLPLDRLPLFDPLLLEPPLLDREPPLREREPPLRDDPDRVELLRAPRLPMSSPPRSSIDCCSMSSSIPPFRSRSVLGMLASLVFATDTGLRTCKTCDSGTLRQSALRSRN